MSEIVAPVKTVGPTLAGAACRAVNTLSAAMLDALLAMGNVGVTAHEIGVNSNALQALAARGLVDADADGRPVIYSLNAFGKEAIAYLNADVSPVDHEQPIARIQRIVAGHFKIPVIEMTSDRRARRVARPRQVAMYLARETTQMSLPTIGRHFGHRDHTTVMHACRTIENLMQTDGKMALAVARLMHKIDGEMTDQQREKDAVRGSEKLLNAIMAMAA